MPGLGRGTLLAMVPAAFVLAAAAPAALAPTARDTLTQAAFFTADRPTALVQINAAHIAASAVLTRAPTDQEALITRAIAISYRAKLNGNRRDALSAKTQFEALVARYPRDAEAQAALGGWHLGAVTSLGGLMARGALGARKGIGLEAIDRAVALGGDRALFLGLAGLFRLQLDPTDARGMQLTAAAARGATPTALDRLMQRRAAQVAVAVKGGDRRQIKALATRLLPMGQFAS